MSDACNTRRRGLVGVVLFLFPKMHKLCWVLCESNAVQQVGNLGKRSIFKLKVQGKVVNTQSCSSIKFTISKFKWPFKQLLFVVLLIHLDIMTEKLTPLFSRPKQLPCDAALSDTS